MMMIIMVMAGDAISDHGARDRANGTADDAARDRAADKSGLIGHSGTRQSKRRRYDSGQDNSIKHAKKPFVKTYATVSPIGGDWFHGRFGPVRERAAQSFIAASGTSSSQMIPVGAKLICERP
jgi:hypothetical protein